MKRKFLKVLVAVLSLGAIGIFAAGCGVGGLEQPEWIKQALCDHVFDEKRVLRDASCEEDGMTLKLCTECGKTKIVTSPALGHTEVVTKEAVEVTCTVAGYTEEVKCSVCNEVLQEQVKIPALGHTMEGDTCTVCGFVDTSNYTEVAAEVGEKMVGNIYRIYMREFEYSMYDCFSGIEFKSNGSSYYLTTYDIEHYDGSRGYFANVNYTPILEQHNEEFIKVSPNHDEGYVDFYIVSAGCILDYDNQVYITEDTVIESFHKADGNIFRLVPPGEETIVEIADGSLLEEGWHRFYRQDGIGYLLLTSTSTGFEINVNQEGVVINGDKSLEDIGWEYDIHEDYVDIYITYIEGRLEAGSKWDSSGVYKVVNKSIANG